MEEAVCRFPFGAASCVVVDGTSLRTGVDARRSGPCAQKGQTGCAVLESSRRNRRVGSDLRELLLLRVCPVPVAYGAPGHRAITPCCGQVREKGVDCLVNMEEGSRVSHGGFNAPPGVSLALKSACI